MTNGLPPALAIIVPCLNEEAALPHSAAALTGILAALKQERAIAEASAVYFVDDGSVDATWQVICALNAGDPSLRGIRLSRNVGQQRAMLAGLTSVEADLFITMDADLQDDPSAIPRMVKANAEGADIVLGVRMDRSADTPGKRVPAQVYYRVMKRLLGVDLVEDHADFRLMSRRAVDALSRFPERNVFLRAMVPLLGFPTATVEYPRGRRNLGVSKYSLGKLLALALDGVTAFSVAPLRLILWLGILTAGVSFAASAWALFVWAVGGTAIPGWTSIVLPMTLLGGVQLISLGIVGEYLARIYTETKARPHFFIQERL